MASQGPLRWSSGCYAKERAWDLDQARAGIAALEKGGEAEREIRGSGVEDLEPSERGERDRFTFLNWIRGVTHTVHKPKGLLFMPIFWGFDNQEVENLTIPYLKPAAFTQERVSCLLPRLKWNSRAAIAPLKAVGPMNMDLTYIDQILPAATGTLTSVLSV